MTSTDTYTSAASKARQATEKSVEAWKENTRAITGQADLVSKLPTVDLTQPVARYFDYVQKSVDLYREMVTKWAELVGSLSGVVREQAEKAGHIVTEQTEKAADLATEQAEKAELAAHEQAEKIEQASHEQAEQIEQAERERARQAKQAERERAKQAREKAREPYTGLTKAELADQLAERELPRTGTVEELIERLVSADSK